MTEEVTVLSGRSLLFSGQPKSIACLSKVKGLRKLLIRMTMIGSVSCLHHFNLNNTWYKDLHADLDEEVLRLVIGKASAISINEMKRGIILPAA